MQEYDPNTASFVDPNATANIVDTVIETAKTVAPIIAVSDPKAAAIIDVAIPAVKLLQQVIEMNQIGVVTDKALADMFADVGASVLANHVKWNA